MRMRASVDKRWKWYIHVRGQWCRVAVRHALPLRGGRCVSMDVVTDDSVLVAI